MSLAPNIEHFLFTMGIMDGAGYLGGNSLRILRRDVTRLEHVGILLLVVALTVFLAYRYYNTLMKGNRP